MSSPVVNFFDTPTSRQNALLTNPFGQTSSQTFKRTPTTEEIRSEKNYTDLTARWKAGAEQAEKTRQTNAELGVSTDYLIDKAEDATGAGSGSLAKIYKPKPGKALINVLTDYTWTISDKYRRSDVPYIMLTENKIESGSIQRQLNFYAQGGLEATADVVDRLLDVEGLDEEDPLSVYKEIFPRNTKDCFIYKFPYFAKSYYELNTPQWQQFDKIGNALGQISGGAEGVLGSLSKVGGLPGAVANAAKEAIGITSKAVSFAANLGMTGLQTMYPVVGIADRPRTFTSHNERTIRIEFPLYNTFNSFDWIRNKDFIQLFAAQNLFNKRNFITGLPPVWYEVLVPGTYFSVASCVTTFDVQNLGNIRMMKWEDVEFPVPDAYQVSITLTEMAMPSRNQFQAATSKAGLTRVTTRTVETSNVLADAATTKRQQLDRAHEPPKTPINAVDALTLDAKGNAKPGASNAALTLGCWVARAVYGETNPSWLIFRSWMLNDSPIWFKNMYCKFGERFANFIKNKPFLKKLIKYWMDYIIENK